MTEAMTAEDILTALKAASDDKIWATELALFGTSRRIDFWTLAPTASQHFRACAHEIKISRADYRRDNEDKQAGALQFSDRFWYVTPPGLLSPDELPAWAGLQEWDGRHFAVRRKAPRRQRAEPTWEFIVSLMRNCGESRRDVGLLKSENAFLKYRLDYFEKAERRRSEQAMARWAQIAARQTPSPEPPP